MSSQGLGCWHGLLPFRVCADTSQAFFEENWSDGRTPPPFSARGVGKTRPREMPARAPSCITFDSDVLATPAAHA